MVHFVGDRQTFGLVLIWFWGIGMTVLLKWLPGVIERLMARKPKKNDEAVTRLSIFVTTRENRRDS